MSENLPKDWFYSDNGKQTGPFTLKEMVGFINLKTITPDTLVWHKNLDDWKKAGETPLKAFFRAAPPAPPPSAPSPPLRSSAPKPSSPPPFPPSPPTHSAARSSYSPPIEQTMAVPEKKNYVVIGIIAVSILAGGWFLLSSFKIGDKKVSESSQTQTRQTRATETTSAKTKSASSNNGIISDEEIFNLWNDRFNKYKGCKNITIENFNRENGYALGGDVYEAKIFYEITYRAPTIPKKYSSDLGQYYDILKMPGSNLAQEYLEGCEDMYRVSDVFSVDMKFFRTNCLVIGRCKEIVDFFKGNLKDERREKLTLVRGDKGWMIESRF